MTECWQETIGKKLIKNVEVTIDDNKTYLPLSAYFDTLA